MRLESDKTVSDEVRPSRARSVSSRSAQSNDDFVHIRIPKVRVSKPGIAFDRMKAAMVVGILLLSLGGGFLGGYWANRGDGSGTVTGTLSNEKKVVTSQSQLISEIAKTVGPSVVSVDVVSTTSSSQSTTNPFSLFYGNDGGQQQQEEDAGTGIILNSDGLIITNRHVVPSGTTSVSVTLSDGTKLDNVKVVGRTSDSDNLDIAFLKISDAKGHKLTPASIGDSSEISVGDAVVAIGNALGQFQNTVTSGIISGFGRSITAGDSSGYSSTTENLENLFQTDAAINEGNSGGPLVNMNGQVIGINTAIASDSQNVGFAIPINDVAGLIKQVEATGKFERPYIGVRYVPLTADIAKQYDLSVTDGAFIVPSVDSSNPSIVAGSPAEKAGLQEGDVVTEINGTKIDQTHSVTSLIDQHAVGDTVHLTVVRDGKTMDVSVTLAAAPSS